jgi:hypothetical protein
MSSRLSIALGAVAVTLSVALVDARRELASLRTTLDASRASESLLQRALSEPTRADDDSTTANAEPASTRATLRDTVLVERPVPVQDPATVRALALADERIAQLEGERATLRRELESRALLEFRTTKGATVRYLGTVDAGMAYGEGYGVWATGSSYDGEWQANRRHGTGSFTWPDGERYVGNYRDDLRTGPGTYFWKDGRRWEGEWLNDMRHGDGVLYEADGRVRARGRWEKDKLIREVK